jgi:hypothetical protein
MDETNLLSLIRPYVDNIYQITTKLLQSVSPKNLPTKHPEERNKCSSFVGSSAPLQRCALEHAGGHKRSWLGLGASSLSSVSTSSDSFPPVSMDRTLVSMDPSVGRGQSIWRRRGICRCGMNTNWSASMRTETSRRSWAARLLLLQLPGRDGGVALAPRLDE